MICIGIDHDTKAHGLAIFNTEDKTLQWSADDTDKLLTHLPPPSDNVRIFMEGTWLQKGFYARYHKRTMKVGAAMQMAVNILESHAAGQSLYELLFNKGYEIILISAINKKMFKRDGAWTPTGRELFSQIFSPQKGEINDDTRDAVLIINHIIDISNERRRSGRPYTRRDSKQLFEGNEVN